MILIVRSILKWSFLAAILLIFPVLATALNIRLPYEPSFIDPLKSELRVMPLPATSSKSMIIFEETTGTILYQKNADEIIPPASLTKLVVMALALDFVKTNNIALDTVVNIRPEAWAANAPTRSSLMFLGPRQTCTWQDLLLGLSVDSGNDAALAIAEEVSGSVEAFVVSMNKLCERLGMKSTYFVEPSGYDEHNVTSARDYSYFVWNYLRMFPQATEMYHSVREFTYPHENDQKGIRQVNRNKLLFAYPGADGLKTGFIDESGYNLAFTAKRANMRLAGVILGGSSETNRFNDARSLLDYGFDQYQLISLPYQELKSIRIWNGSQPLLNIPSGAIAAILPTSMIQGLSSTIEQLQEVEGPVAAESILAWKNIYAKNGKILFHIPIKAGFQIDEANFFVQWSEKAYLAVRKLAGQPWPQKASINTR